jgi:hypothetical protein
MRQQAHKQRRHDYNAAAGSETRDCPTTAVTTFFRVFALPPRVPIFPEHEKTAQTCKKQCELG